MKIIDRCTCYSAYGADIKTAKYIEACKKLAHYEDMDEQSRLFVLPVAVGGLVYEIVTDERTEPYIEEYEVTDVSVKGVEYAGDWIDWECENLYTNREDAERTLRKLMEAEA